MRPTLITARAVTGRPVLVLTHRHCKLHTTALNCLNFLALPDQDSTIYSDLPEPLSYSVVKVSHLLRVHLWGHTPKEHVHVLEVERDGFLLNRPSSNVQRPATAHTNRRGGVKPRVTLFIRYQYRCIKGWQFLLRAEQDFSLTIGSHKKR